MCCGFETVEDVQLMYVCCGFGTVGDVQLMYVCVVCCGFLTVKLKMYSLCVCVCECYSSQTVKNAQFLYVLWCLKLKCTVHICVFWFSDSVGCTAHVYIYVLWFSDSEGKRFSGCMGCTACVCVCCGFQTVKDIQLLYIFVCCGFEIVRDV